MNSTWFFRPVIHDILIDRPGFVLLFELIVCPADLRKSLRRPFVGVMLSNNILKSRLYSRIVVEINIGNSHAHLQPDRLWMLRLSCKDVLVDLTRLERLIDFLRQFDYSVNSRWTFLIVMS